MTREKAINVLANEKECVLRETCERLECASCELVMPVGNILSAYDIAIAALREQEERKWVPVSERLPDADGIYLCVWQGKKVDTGFFLNRHFRIYGEIKDRLVTHWMPLPELPKEG